MPELNFEVLNVEAARHAAVPTLYFKLAVEQATRQGERPVPIQSIALQCQLRIDSRRRTYKAEEKASLSDLFGEPERWSQTLHSMLWTHASVVVPAFEEIRSTVDLPVHCSFDFNLATTKYFHGLEQGDVPLLMLFSGTVFYHGPDGTLAMDLISWSKEIKYRLPIGVWRAMMDTYYPNGTWLRVNRTTFEALYEYKRRHGYTGFDEALDSLLCVTKKALAS